MEMTRKLKERFCKDMNIPISMFDEPYFTDRLKLYDKQFETLKKYSKFMKLLEGFDSEQDYFGYYNKLKDEIINYLGESEGMNRFKEEDMNKYQVKNVGFPSKDIFKPSFSDRVFLSVDMKKANFTALKHYSKDIVGGQDTYEEFIGMFTESEYLKSSKYIRQVVFGNQSPKRQITYEKHLMDELLTKILEFVDKELVVFFSNDEIVLDMTENYSGNDIAGYTKKIDTLLYHESANEGVNFRQELFLLKHIPGVGYIKSFINKPGVEFKCIDSVIMPFVLRKFQGEVVQESDKVFYANDGRKAMLLDIPEIVIEV